MTAEPGALAARMDQIGRRLSMRNYTDSGALLAAVEAALKVHYLRDPAQYSRPSTLPHCGYCGGTWPCSDGNEIREAITRELLSEERDGQR
jgi:hypothetical protein